MRASPSSARAALLAAVALGVAGCADRGGIRPQLQARNIEQLDAGTALSASTGAAVPWHDGQWWTAFGDPQLDRLIDTALSTSPTLDAADARLRSAEAMAGIARAASLPQAGAEAESTRNHFTEHQFIPPPYAGNDYWDNKIVVEARYSLDLWGRDRAQLDSAIDEARASAAETRAARLSLQTTIVRSYAQLAQIYALRDIAQDSLNLRQQVYDITQRRLDAGLATQVELAQAETALPSARAALAQLDGRIALLGAQLAALAGQGPGAGESLKRPTLALDRLPALPDTLPAHWIGRRPDIAADRWRVESAARGIKAAEAQFYPDINLSATAGYEALSFAQLLQGDSLLSAIGPAITLPLFTGGKLRAQLGARTAAYDAAVARYNEALIQALQQAASAVLSLRAIDQQRHETATAEQSAAHAYTLAMSGYRAGLTEYLSVLSTQTAVLSERRRAAELDGQRLDAYAQLVSALGGGFDTQHVPTAD